MAIPTVYFLLLDAIYTSFVFFVYNQTTELSATVHQQCWHDIIARLRGAHSRIKCNQSVVGSTS